MHHVVKKILNVGIPIVIVLSGVQATTMLIDSKKPPKSNSRPSEKIRLVHVMNYEPTEHQVTVKAQAVTKPVVELSISTHVKGEISWVSPAMVEGGWVEKDSLIFKIDPIDYQLQVQQAQAGLATATYELEAIMAQKTAAESGRKLYQKLAKNNELPEISENLSGLAKFEPQVVNAKAVLKSASANLEQALLNLSRTEVHTPSSGYIRSTTLAVGQIIASGQTVATLFKDKPVVLNVSLPISELNWILVQETPQGVVKIGSDVLVSKLIGQEPHFWKGIVKRQLQEITSLGRLVTVIVEIEEPVSDKGFTLPMGMLVDVEIKGKTLKNVFAVPHEIIHKDSIIWVLSKENRLEFRPVTIARKNEIEVFISTGITLEDSIVITQIPSAVQGMKLAKAEKRSFDAQPEKPKKKSDRRFRSEGIDE